MWKIGYKMDNKKSKGVLKSLIHTEFKMIFYKNTLNYKATESSALHTLHSKVIIHY